MLMSVRLCSSSSKSDKVAVSVKALANVFTIERKSAVKSNYTEACSHSARQYSPHLLRNPQVPYPQEPPPTLNLKDLVNIFTLLFICDIVAYRPVARQRPRNKQLYNCRYSAEARIEQQQ
jgi:hypothetical protein